MEFKTEVTIPCPPAPAASPKARRTISKPIQLPGLILTTTVVADLSDPQFDAALAALEIRDCVAIVYYEPYMVLCSGDRALIIRHLVGPLPASLVALVTDARIIKAGIDVVALLREFYVLGQVEGASFLELRDVQQHAATIRRHQAAVGVAHSRHSHPKLDLLIEFFTADLTLERSKSTNIERALSVQACKFFCLALRVTDTMDLLSVAALNEDELETLVAAPAALDWPFADFGDEDAALLQPWMLAKAVTYLHACLAAPLVLPDHVTALLPPAFDRTQPFTHLVAAPPAYALHKPPLPVRASPTKGSPTLSMTGSPRLEGGAAATTTTGLALTWSNLVQATTTDSGSDSSHSPRSTCSSDGAASNGTDASASSTASVKLSPTHPLYAALSAHLANGGSVRQPLSSLLSLHYPSF